MTKLEDLKGKTISVNKGSAYDSWAREREGQIGWKVESFGTQTDAVQAVLVGRADANVAGNTVIAWAVKNNPQLDLSFLHSTGLVWAAPLRKDSGEMRKTLENAVECMKLDSTIAKMHEKWFGVAPPRARPRSPYFPATAFLTCRDMIRLLTRPRAAEWGGVCMRCRGRAMSFMTTGTRRSSTSAACARIPSPRGAARNRSRGRCRRNWSSSSDRRDRARARCCAAATAWRSRPPAPSGSTASTSWRARPISTPCGGGSAWCSSRSISIRT